jgi:hypothetical protein
VRLLPVIFAPAPLGTSIQTDLHAWAWGAIGRSMVTPYAFAADRHCKVLYHARRFEHDLRPPGEFDALRATSAECCDLASLERRSDACRALRAQRLAGVLDRSLRFDAVLAVDAPAWFLRQLAEHGFREAPRAMPPARLLVRAPQLPPSSADNPGGQQEETP